MGVVEIRGTCECPGSPHDEDVAAFRSELGLEGGLAIVGIVRRAAAGELTTSQAEVEMGIAYVSHGLLSWNWTNGTGDAIPINDENLRRGVPWVRMYPIADKAASLYGDSVFAPLVPTASKSSRTGPTAVSTSRTSTSSKSRRKR